jgi:hypothetical protein
MREALTGHQLQSEVIRYSSKGRRDHLRLIVGRSRSKADYRHARHATTQHDSSARVHAPGPFPRHRIPFEHGDDVLRPAAPIHCPGPG